MSWKGVVLGSLATFGIILTLGSVAGFVVANVFELFGTAGAAEGDAATGSAASGLVIISLTLLLAFLVGGYVAGRTASRVGARHGLLVALLALVATLFLAVVGAMLGSGLVNGLSGVRLPSTIDDVQSLSGIVLVIGVLALILPFVGGAVGGVRGAQMSRRRRR